MKKLLSLIIASGLLLSACQTSETTGRGPSDPAGTAAGTAAGTEQTSPETAPQELEAMTFVLDWTPNTNHTGIYVAAELGYYAEEGIELDIQSPPEDGAALLVASGGADVGVSFQDSLAPAFSSDEPMPLTAIATLINHNTSGIVSLKEKGITSAGKLPGHTYATWGLPVEQAMMKQVVEDEGGNWDDVELFPSTVTDVQAALQTQVDAVWIYYAWDGIALEQAGHEINFWEFGEINPAFDFYNPILITSNDYLAENPEQIKAFLRATEKGYRYAIEHPEEAAAILVDAAPGLDSELVKASQIWLADHYIADAPRWGYMDQERWDGFYGWLWENDLIEVEIPAGTGFTNDYLPGN